ncbi:MAG: PilZ domain-containing protein [Thermodesulfobacteriota bacterium]
MGPISEKRRFPRLGSVHLVSYTQLDKEKNPVETGMCKSLELSQGGVTIQTHIPFAVNTGLEMVIAIEERLIKSKGRVVHSRQVGRGRYDVGVCFAEVEEEDRLVMQDFFQKLSAE